MIYCEISNSGREKALTAWEHDDWGPDFDGNLCWAYPIGLWKMGGYCGW